MNRFILNCWQTAPVAGQRCILLLLLLPQPVARLEGHLGPAPSCLSGTPVVLVLEPSGTAGVCKQSHLLFSHLVRSDASICLSTWMCLYICACVQILNTCAHSLSADSHPCSSTPLINSYAFCPSKVHIIPQQPFVSNDVRLRLQVASKNKQIPCLIRCRDSLK